MKQSARAAFTLIELLVVIVIVGILVAVTIPAVSTLLKSGGLSASTRHVANALSLARQYAITHRTITRVVFPYSGTAGTNRAPWYQSFAVIDMGQTNYLTKWELLPAGAVFVDDNLALGLTTPRPCLDNLSREYLPFPNTNVGNSATLAFIEFRPTGAASASPAGGASVLTITEGFMNGTAVTPTSKTPTNTIANMATITVDNLVGRIAATRPQ
jgi:prepilin-type N-terminal cleavage/methylation domain-containing protein